MSRTYDVAIIVGSLRKASVNRILAQAIADAAPANLRFRFVEIGDLPLYNEELDADGAVPASWTRFRQEVAAADAVMFVTPEYNRSLPGALKNAIDVGSRPYGASVWARKPAAVITGSPGGVGGFGANHHLRQSLVFLDMPVLQQPEAYIGHLYDLFDGTTVKSDGTRTYLASIGAAFARLIERMVD